MNDESTDLFERLGGARALTEIVKDHYDRVFADPELADYFEGVDQERLTQMQFQFLASAFGGPVYYAGSELTAIHRPAKVSAKAFARFCGHFADALEAHGASKRDVDDALGRLATFKDTVTGESNVDG